MSAARALGSLTAQWGRPDVVFLGDSITEFWVEADPWLFWSRRLNLGVSGFTTGQMLDRFEREVVALAPRVIHVMGGTNDLWYGSPGPDASIAFDNLKEIAERGKALGMEVVLASTPPISAAARLQFAYPDLLPVLQSAIRGYCLSAGVLHADYAHVLADQAGTIRPHFSDDGVHLNRAGYGAIREQTERQLARALHASRQPLF